MKAKTKSKKKGVAKKSAPSETKNPGGRPLVDVDAEQVKTLARFGLSYAEIAASVGCSHDTIERRFASAIKEGHEHRNSSLRRRQFEVAMDGNPTMLIWLGKQYLEQRDKLEASGPEGQPLPGVNVNLTSLSDEQLEQFARIVTQLASNSSGAGSTPQAAV